MAITLHRCEDCSHSHLDHQRVSDSRCSHGYCPCRLSQRDVTGRNPSVEVPTFPAYNITTGKWATRETGEWS